MVVDLGCLTDIQQDSLGSFIDRYPAQVVLVGIQMFWTHESEVSLNMIRSEKGVMQNTQKKFKQVCALVGRGVRVASTVF